MPRVFTPEQIQWMREQRRIGHLPPQIANDFPIRFPGEKKPADTTVYNRTGDVQVLIEEEEPMEDEETLEEPGETTPKPISEKRKKEETEILNEFIAKKPLVDILKEHHHTPVFKMQKVHERDVIGDKFTRYKNLLVGAGVYNAKSKNPIADAILDLVEIAGKAESDLEFTKSTIESDKNKIFGEYQEREEDLKRKLLEQKETLTEKIHILERTVRETKKTFSCKEIQWANYVKNLKEAHAEQIALWRKKVQDITYHSLKYEAAMDFSKSPDELTEAYMKGIFNAVIILYAPFITSEKFRDSIEYKLERACRQRDWNQFMSIIMKLAKKVSPQAEEWVKQESFVVSQARDDMRKELYNKLRFFGFAGSLQDLTEAIDNYRTLPSKLKRMEHRFKELKPTLEEMKIKEEVLLGTIPELQKIEEEQKTIINRVIDNVLKLNEKLEKWMDPKAHDAFKKDIAAPVAEVMDVAKTVFTQKPHTKQSLSEYLGSKREKIKKDREN